MEKSPLDFANEDSPQRITEGDGMIEPRLQNEVAAMGPPVNKRHRKKDNAEAEANASPKVLRKDHAPVCPEQSTRGGKSLALIGLEADSTFTSAAQETPVTGEERIKAIFEEFKKYEDDKVEKYCTEIDVCLDALSIDFDEELYPHMLTAIAGFKILVDRSVEKLKDALLDLIMASLHLESDTGEDAPQWIRKFRPSSSQLTIPVYPEVRNPKDPWACKEEILLRDAIAANISHAEKKKKCRVVYRTHGIGSAYHARSDG
ncbi:hypothetical protein Tco_1573004, partial [Tanacetum coccineum]